ncbi:hypothetical protein BD626DRAFT_508569 [Schizophyllum amplum]|uniref:Uncharacterized protein n=1 Tax=Schizophyllum amplum TaxID=97359 RepID=A0A550C330_9AGAR|nr:hypothetical protein BD626DRAFT_508569 [Auriculariopsis ampla]
MCNILPVAPPSASYAAFHCSISLFAFVPSIYTPLDYVWMTRVPTRRLPAPPSCPHRSISVVATLIVGLTHQPWSMVRVRRAIFSQGAPPGHWPCKR